jgi:peptidoglycan hydrolase-like protein with peptidoglycan-binding domain
MFFANKTYADPISLSQSNLTLSIGQTTTVYVNNYNYNYYYGNLYISSNSNSNVASASVSSNNGIFVTANNNGNTIITVCQNGTNYSCGTIYVTVSGGYYSLNNPGFNISNLNLSVGDSITVSSPNSSSVYLSNNSNPSVVSASYSSLPAGCFDGNQYSITTGQPCYQNYYNNYNYNNYYNGSFVITAVSTGSSTLVLCQNQNYNYNNYYNNNNCNTVYVSVNNIAPVAYPTYQTYPNYPIYSYADYLPTYPSVLGASTCYFSTTLRYGMSGTDVSCLQTLLSNQGYLTNSSYSSYFDQATLAAVRSFQSANYLNPDGVVGRLTRARLFQ